MKFKYSIWDFLIVLFFVITFLFSPAFADEFSPEKTVVKSEKARVIAIDDFEGIDNLPEVGALKQVVEVELLTGENRGEKVIIENMITGNPAYDIFLNENDKVVLHVEEGQGSVDYFIADKYRMNGIIFFVGLFCLLLVVVGRKKGFASLLAIGITLALIFWVLRPLVLLGVSPILSAVLVCFLSATAAIYLVGGFNPKSTSAIIGTVLSLLIGGILSLLAIKVSYLTGFAGEANMFLFSAHPELNFVGLLAASMIIAALGAVMDVGMSISSTINELNEKACDMSVKELFKSGMNVGQDIIGTMANTLILAYLGGSLSLVLLSVNIDMNKFFNLNQVSTEILAALVGSISIVICVPITAIVAAYLIHKNTPKEPIVGVEENAFDDIIG